MADINCNWISTDKIQLHLTCAFLNNELKLKTPVRKRKTVRICLGTSFTTTPTKLSVICTCSASMPDTSSGHDLFPINILYKQCPSRHCLIWVYKHFPNKETSVVVFICSFCNISSPSKIILIRGAAIAFLSVTANTRHRGGKGEREGTRSWIFDLSSEIGSF